MAEQFDSEGNIREGLEETDDSSDERPDSESSTDGDEETGATDAEKRKFRDDDESPEGEQNKKQKVSVGFSRTFGAAVTQEQPDPKKNVAPISIKLGAQGIKKTTEAPKFAKKASSSVAMAFNQDSDEEEMPPEAKMRMRNIGRDTPTSTGPNSFGKTRQGFCDVKKIFERQLKKQLDDVQK